MKRKNYIYESVLDKAFPIIVTTVSMAITFLMLLAGGFFEVHAYAEDKSALNSEEQISETEEVTENVSEFQPLKAEELSDPFIKIIPVTEENTQDEGNQSEETEHTSTNVYANTEQAILYNALSDEDKMVIHEASTEFNVDEALVLAIAYNETRFNATATNVNTNGTTDWGLGQSNDTCFNYLHQQLGITSMDQLLNIKMGARAICALLKYAKDAVGPDTYNTLLAYQEGVGNYWQVKKGYQKPWNAFYTTSEAYKIFSTMV